MNKMCWKMLRCWKKHKILKKALNDALNIIIEAFENRIIESEYHPDLVVGTDLSNNRESDLLPASDSNKYESHGFTDR